MPKPLTPQQALTRAATLCARCEQAPGDIRAKLRQWGLDEAQTQETLQQLAEQGYLNEQRYAHAFVNDHVKFNGWGKRKIAFALAQKGIPSTIVRTALDEVDDTLYHKQLATLLSDKLRNTTQREPRLQRAALMRFAASRGFEEALVRQCVDQLLSTTSDDGDDAATD